MKIPNNALPHKVASTDADPLRRNINCLKLEMDDKGARLIATDGRALVVLPVETEDGDTPGLIPRQALEMASDPELRQVTIDDDMGNLKDVTGPTTLALSEHKAVLTDGLEVVRPALDWPKWESVATTAPAEECTRIALNARLLLNIQEALGADWVTLQIKNAVSPIRVTSGYNTTPKEAFGVLMPVRLS